MVDEVGDVHAVGPQHPVDLGDRLAGGEMPRRADPAERVADDEVPLPRRLLRQPHAAVGHVDEDDVGLRRHDADTGQAREARFVLDHELERVRRVQHVLRKLGGHDAQLAIQLFELLLVGGRQLRAGFRPVL